MLCQSANADVQLLMLGYAQRNVVIGMWIWSWSGFGREAEYLSGRMFEPLSKRKSEKMRTSGLSGANLLKLH